MDTIKNRQAKKTIEEYYSAEFQLNQSKIMYHFKLRKSRTESMFAVLKEGSKALEDIKEGDIIDMRYYYTDKSLPAEQKQTRIKYITKDSSAGFKDHFVVGLAFFAEEGRGVA
ncbi:MAG: hypothetical protein ABIJ31_13840 [Pseudomonadota bacterium]